MLLESFQILPNWNSDQFRWIRPSTCKAWILQVRQPFIHFSILLHRSQSHQVVAEKENIFRLKINWAKIVEWTFSDLGLKIISDINISFNFDIGVTKERKQLIRKERETVWERERPRETKREGGRERERERERLREREGEGDNCVCECVHTCLRERERESSQLFWGKIYCRTFIFWLSLPLSLHLSLPLSLYISSLSLSLSLSLTLSLLPLSLFKCSLFSFYFSPSPLYAQIHFRFSMKHQLIFMNWKFSINFDVTEKNGSFLSRLNYSWASRLVTIRSRI